MSISDGRASKAYLHGTHRAVAPAETLARFRPFAARMGITRLADVTGLDYLGIPVVMACRPNSRALAVSQGKGLDLDSARISGFMESAETFHAENIDRPIVVGTRAALMRDRRVIAFDELPQTFDCAVTDETELPWIEAEDLLGGGPIWLPYDQVHTDCRDRREHESHGDFPISSNGLASGNHRLEAICAGLYELIERDANALWGMRTREGRAATRLDLDSVDDPYCRVLIDRLREAKMLLSVWEMTSDLGIAAFFARLREMPDNPHVPHLGAFCGAGCHLSRGIALSRAVTEAVQSRLTYISGSRDDLKNHNYDEAISTRLGEFANRLWEQRIPARRFADVPHSIQPDFEADLALMLDRLRAAGIEHACAIDLTRADIGIPVVRMVVPGLEFDPADVPDCAPGRRALAFAKARP